MDRRLVTGIILICAMTCLGCAEEETPTEPPSPKTGDLEGRVYTGNWSGISGARVCVVPVGCATTDSRSWYDLEDIEEGNHMITASAPGYRSYQGSVRIYADNNNQFHVQLEPEPGSK